MLSNGITYGTGLGSILLVDDEDHITALLKYNLESEGYRVMIDTEAYHASETDLTGYRIMLVDAMGQQYNGRDLLKSIKSNPLTAHIPIIMLSHSDSEDDIIAAFGDGADDYILKPFSLRELVARVKSVLRRNPLVAGAQGHGAVINIGPLAIDLTTRIVTNGTQQLALTKTEFAILAFLAKNKGAYFNRQQIYREVWPDSDREETGRIVDTNISRLRKKMGAAATFLVNKSGMGYSIQD